LLWSGCTAVLQFCEVYRRRMAELIPVRDRAILLLLKISTFDQTHGRLPCSTVQVLCPLGFSVNSSKSSRCCQMNTEDARPYNSPPSFCGLTPRPCLVLIKHSYVDRVKVVATAHRVLGRPCSDAAPFGKWKFQNTPSFPLPYPF